MIRTWTASAVMVSTLPTLTCAFGRRFVCAGRSGGASPGIHVVAFLAAVCRAFIRFDGRCYCRFGRIACNGRPPCRSNRYGCAQVCGLEIFL